MTVFSLNLATRRQPMRRCLIVVCSVLFMAFSSSCTQKLTTTETALDQRTQTTSHVKSSKPLAKNAIASAHPLATQAGMEILAQGGNAFDAAIAVAAVLGVVEPYSAGIGGGGFWLLHRATDGKDIMVDARETAPQAAHRDLYLDANGNVDRDKATHTALAAGIPGQAAAFAHLAEHYGQLPLSTSLRSAIQYARKGFPADSAFVNRAKGKAAVFARYPESNRIFAHDGQLKTSDIIIQTDLADTLGALADQGAAGFYQGAVAEKLVAGTRAAGGIWTLADLATYKVVEREPIRFDYLHASVVTAPPPSSGGIVLAQMFSMLAQLEQTENLNGDQRTHILLELMRRAYRDRAEYLGDPDFVRIPAKLQSVSYNKQLIENLSRHQATPSSELPAATATHSGTNTTHLSVLDKAGNYVAATLSINTSFGSGVTLPGTGVLLNNEMDDFSAKPGAANAYGLVGNEANAIEPGKRPLSSMTPTFMRLHQGKQQQVAILGTPGGSRIITMVFLGMLEALGNKLPEAWVNRPRFHHQYLPDIVFHEPSAFSADSIRALENMGHKLKSSGRDYGNMQAILWDQTNGEVHAASDPRGIGEALVGSQTIKKSSEPSD